MSLDNRPVYSGGCQCGAVRFRVEGALGDASICHCRMCQKASGNFYLPLVSVRGAKLAWTRGEPKRFRSSNAATRGFCARLRHAADSTRRPTAWRWPSPPSTTRPPFAPTIQWGTEAKLPYVDADPGLPGEDTMADIGAAPYLADLVSYQHPDHDTDQWPPAESTS